MAFDGIAVSTIVKELNEALISARTNKIYQIDTCTIVLNLRIPGATKKLIISADPRYPRIYISEQDFEYPAAPPAFCMLLRKYLEPSRILAFKQYQLERLIEISFETFDPEYGNSEKKLIFELMGRHSNIILIDHNKVILDAVKRNNHSYVRQVMPGLKYQKPFTKVKYNPKEHTKDKFIDTVRLLSGNIKLSTGLVQLYQGLGPETAKEIIRRAELNPNVLKADTNISDYEKLWYSFNDFINFPGNPVLVLEPKPEFYAYRLTDVTYQKEYSSLNSLLNDFYTAKIHSEELRRQSNSLLKPLKIQLERLIRKEEIQRNTLKQASKAATWQKLGELLLANIYRIKKGDRILEAVDYYQPTQPIISIELDPKLTPGENSQRYFKKYSKAKRSQGITKRQLQKTISERNYIEEIIVHIEQAESLSALAEIKEELIKAGYLHQKVSTSKEKKHKKTPPRYDEYISSDGIVILVGRNNHQNDYLTFKAARADDIWLHAQKLPGSHVIIRADSSIPEQTLLEAATLAAYYSKARTLAKAIVDYTQRKHVKKPAGAKPGFVIYNSFNSITVEPTNSDNLPKKNRP